MKFVALRNIIGHKGEMIKKYEIIDTTNFTYTIKSFYKARLKDGDITNYSNVPENKTIDSVEAVKKTVTKKYNKKIDKGDKNG